MPQIVALFPFKELAEVFNTVEAATSVWISFCLQWGNFHPDWLIACLLAFFPHWIRQPPPVRCLVSFPTWAVESAAALCSLYLWLHLVPFGLFWLCPVEVPRVSRRRTVWTGIFFSSSSPSLFGERVGVLTGLLSESRSCLFYRKLGKGSWVAHPYQQVEVG